MLIALQNFQGERPIANARVLQANEAQAARNVKLWSGKLKPWYHPKLHQQTGLNGTFGIYRYKDKYWLRWPIDVDVVRGPIAGTDRLYWTGDDEPKVGNFEVITGITPLTERAPSGQDYLIVNNVKPFKTGDSIEIQLDSGTQQTTILSIVKASNRLNIADALTGSAAIGKSVANLRTEYPLASYPLGVPAPGGVLTVSAGENAGTVVGVPNFLASGSNTSTSLDLVVDSDGGAIEFKISADIDGQIFGLQSKEVVISVIRDPGGDDEEIFSHVATKTVQGAVGGQFAYFPLAAEFRWSTEEDSEAYIFRYSGNEGEETYRVTITDGFVPANIVGIPSTKTYALSAVVRYAGNLEFEISPSTHGLKEGDKLQFSDVVGTDSLNDINKDPVSIIAVDGAVVSVDSEAFGDYVSGGTWVQFWDAEDLATRNYVYTYVATLDDKDMEGPPSSPSAQINIGDNQPVQLSGIVDPRTVDDRPYSKVRIYRVAVGTVSEEYLFVDELALGQSNYTDEVRGTALGEVLPSLTWDPPPEDLINIIELPAGVMAGILRNSNEVAFSAPYQPHAWPPEYRRSMRDITVGIGSFGSSIIVGTKGRPTLLTGIAPDNLSEEHVESIHPCLSKRGLVDMGYAVLYPSKTGLVLTTIGLVDVVTQKLFSPDEWLKLNPSSFVAAAYDDRYVCFYDNGQERAGFILDPRNPSATLTFIDLWARDVWSDPETGELYLVLPKEGGTEDIVAWNEDRVSVPQMFRWRSKEFVSALPLAMNVVKVDADSYPVKINLFMDGQLFDTMDVFSSQPVRCIDELGQGRLWEVEVIGDTDVDAVYVAPNMQTLTRYFSGVA